MSQTKPIDTSKWTRSDILREAQMQSGALARLGTWKRLAYSLMAIGFLLGLWGINGGVASVVVVSVVCLVLGVPASIVLTVGVNRGKANVKNMLAAAGMDVEELLAPRGKRSVEGAAQASVADASKKHK